jgi:hopanoid biosynthesis associated RND transporter like protein HpnN
LHEFEAVLGRGLAAWVDGVRRRPGPVIAAMLLASLAIGVHAARNLAIRGDTDSLFASELPFKRAEARYHEAFPMLYENLFVVVDGVTPERAGEAAAALAQRMQDAPAYFHTAYLPGGGDFFEEHAFLYLETAELEELADRLARAQPYLAELSRDGSLRGLASMLARGVRAVREGDVEGAQLGAMFERFADALEARLAGRTHHLSWAEVLAQGSFEGDARRRFLLVQPVYAVGDLQPAKRAILEIRRLAAELGLTPEQGVEVRITGDAALSYEEMQTLRDQAVGAGVASFVLVGLILLAGLRSLRLVLAALATLVVGLVWTAGFTALAIGHFNMISVSFAVLCIGLGIDFGTHLCMRYRELLDHGRGHAAALCEAARDVGSSIVLCALTTAVGFFAFVPTDFVGVAELGLISGAGMFISLFCTLTLLPALMSLRPLRAGSGAPGDVGWSRRLGELPIRHPRAVRVGAAALLAGAVLVLPEARFDNNPLNVRDPRSESVRTFEDLLARGSSSPWSVNALAPDLERAERLAESLRGLDVVERAVTVADYVPADQQEKLDIIEDVAMFLAPLPDSGEGSSGAGVEARIQALRDLEYRLHWMLREGAPPDLAPAASRLRRALGLYLAGLADSSTAAGSVAGLADSSTAAGSVAGLADSSTAAESLAALEEGLLGSLPEQLRTLDAALQAGHVTLENLPAALLERQVAADGRVRVEVFPREDLLDHAALERFVDAVAALAPELAGSAVEMLESGRVVVDALRQALLSAVVVIAALLLLLWRRLDHAALVLIPLALAAAFTVATAVLAGIPFNFADVIVLPLLLGIGVDSGIHLVHRARVTGGADANLLATSTARAVVVSALTTIASFGTLGFATHQGLATLGRLLTLGVGFTVVCNLVVLPALIVSQPFRERFRSAALQGPRKRAERARREPPRGAPSR